MNSIRLARNASAGLVAGIAAWSSYSHMVHVALSFGERPEVAYLLPFSVDGMLVVASAAMVDDQRARRRVRPAARVAFTAGVAASIAANIAAAAPTVGARIVAAWPAVALLLVVEMLSRTGRSVPGSGAFNVAGAEPAPAEVPPAGSAVAIPLVVPAEVPIDATVEVPDRNDDSRRARGVRRPAAVTRQLAADLVEAEPGLTRKEVAARLGVSTRRLREVMAGP